MNEPMSARQFVVDVVRFRIRSRAESQSLFQRVAHLPTSAAPQRSTERHREGNHLPRRRTVVHRHRLSPIGRRPFAHLHARIVGQLQIHTPFRIIVIRGIAVGCRCCTPSQTEMKTSASPTLHPRTLVAIHRQYMAHENTAFHRRRTEKRRFHRVGLRGLRLRNESRAEHPCRPHTPIADPPRSGAKRPEAKAR